MFRMDTPKYFCLCLLFILVSAALVFSKPQFGVGSGDGFNRPTNFLGNTYQDWRNGFAKRFGDGADGLGSRPVRWVDWSQIISPYQKRNFESAYRKFGEVPNFGKPMWNFEDSDFGKRSP